MTLTDDEQATALRCANYARAGLKRTCATAEDEATLAAVERVIGVLEKRNDNGMWRCLCKNPWRHPDCLACPTCGAAVPS